ncbi:MAG: hypothetical protein ABIV47_06955 [Roseiflexaceae bacterium]
MRKILYIGCLTLALVACGQSGPAAAPTSAATLPTALPTNPTTAAPAPTSAPAPTTAPASTAAIPAASPTASHDDGAATAPPELVNTAQIQLALHLKASPANLLLQDATAKQWPDGALGCPQDGQVYPQVITPGFLLIFTNAAQSEQYLVHTGPNPSQMLLCVSGQPVNLLLKPVAAPAGPDARMGELARTALARELAVAEADIAVVSVEENEWRDSSLGCPKPGVNYLQVITPGYKITLEAQGRRYEYHSDTNRRVVRCDTP